MVTGYALEPSQSPAPICLEPKLSKQIRLISMVECDVNGAITVWVPVCLTQGIIVSSTVKATCCLHSPCQGSRAY